MWKNVFDQETRAAPTAKGFFRVQAVQATYGAGRIMGDGDERNDRQGTTGSNPVTGAHNPGQAGSSQCFSQFFRVSAIEFRKIVAFSLLMLRDEYLLEHPAMVIDQDRDVPGSGRL